VGRGDLQVFRDVPDVRDAQASFRYSWHSPFKLVDSRQNGYKKYAHNLNANSFFVNILFLLIFWRGVSYERSSSYAPLEQQEATSLS